MEKKEQRRNATIRGPPDPQRQATVQLQCLQPEVYSGQQSQRALAKEALLKTLNFSKNLRFEFLACKV